MAQNVLRANGYRLPAPSYPLRRLPVMNPANLLPNLARIFPADRLLTAPAQLAPYESDALTAFKVRPRAVVLAESVDEVIRAVELCHRSGVPFVARGSGTSLSGASLPIEEGIVIALNRLNRITRLDPAQRFAVVEPGVINLNVSVAASPYNLYYAPDPSSQPICTIGGNVAFNSGGAHCLKYGMTSNHVLGLTAVLPDGEVVTLGGESLEPLGPDWTGLFVGNEGLMGIALSVTLRLVPKPERYRTVLAAYHSLQAAGDAVTAVVASGLLPGAMEIMDALAIQAAEASVHAGYPPGAAAVMIVELEGESQQVEAEFIHLKQVVDNTGAFEVRVAQNADERARIWKGRKGAFSAVGRLSPDYIVQDGVVPRTKLGHALAEIDRLSQEYGIRVANVFHAGDGNLHPLILYDGREAGALERAEELAGHILQMCIDLGGSITGEHGVGMEKRAHMPAQFDAENMAALQRLHRAIDPQALANRGKVFPGSPDPIAVQVIERANSAPVPVFENLRPESILQLQDAVRTAKRLRPWGGGTKSALSTPARDDIQRLSLSGLTGILEYDPAEYTITALAGTPVAEVQAALAEHGQYLPFDPPLAKFGATVGGVIASATAGPGRYRYGGVRDFLLGVRYVDGAGRLLRGGGKVVKNAAGFDIPKLFVGSAGRLGVITEATFKVFPAPATTISLRQNHATLDTALAALAKLAAAPFDLESVDLAPKSDAGLGHTLLVRLGGLASILSGRVARLGAFLGGVDRVDVVDGGEETELWAGLRDWVWAPDGWAVARVPLTPSRIPGLESALLTRQAVRHYSVGGNLAWLAVPADDVEALHRILSALNLGGWLLRGAPGRVKLGVHTENAFTRRVTEVFDPVGRFGGSHES